MDDGRLNPLCPDAETLNAAHDGDPGSNWVKIHARDCAACRRHLEILRRLDAMVAGTASCDAATLARIKAGTRHKLSQPRPWFVVWWPTSLKVAASVAALAGVVWLHAALRPTHGTPGDAPMGLASDPSAGTTLADQALADGAPLLLAESSGTEDYLPDATGTLLAARDTDDAAAPAAAPRPPATGAVRLGDARLVGTTAGPAPNRAATRPRGPEDSISPLPAREVADYVWHVWLADDPGVALRELQTLMPHNQAEFDRLLGEKRDRYLLQLMISDRQLDGLVTRLNEQGLRLLSPAAPQPGATGLRLSGKTVQYEVDLVRR